MKEEDWREIHEFMAGTVEYRKSLNGSLKGIKEGMWAVVLVVLIPFTTGMIWIGNVGAKVEQHTKDIVEIKQEMKEIRGSYGKMQP